MDYFDREINWERVKTLFVEVRSLLCKELEPGLVDLLYEEMNQSYTTGFLKRERLNI